MREPLDSIAKDLAEIVIRVGSLSAFPEARRANPLGHALVQLHSDLDTIRARVAILAGGEPVEVLTLDELRQWAVTGRWPARLDVAIRRTS